MMALYLRINAWLWMFLCVVWLVSAFGAKKNIARRPWWMRVPVRIAILVVVFVLFWRPLGGRWLAPLDMLLGSPAIGLAGLILSVAGIAFALWARMVIGRNWGMPMTLKQDAELVTTGPYALVRHPIYSGILLAMLGSGFTISLWWLVFLVLNGVQFFLAAKREERLMLQTFPETYPAYMRRTRMLIPFVF